MSALFHPTIALLRSRSLAIRMSNSDCVAILRRWKSMRRLLRDDDGTQRRESPQDTVVHQETERAVPVGEYAPGSKLIETTPALKTGVSRGPLREAFHNVCESAGSVRNQNNRDL